MSDGAGGAGPQPWTGRRIHLVGVGGAGMSAYARAAHALGASVTGSDANEGPYLEALRADGVLDAHVGHAAANLPGGDGVELYYSSAVAAREPRARRPRGSGGSRSGPAPGCWASCRGCGARSPSPAPTARPRPPR